MSSSSSSKVALHADKRQYSDACRRAIQENRADQVERALHASLDDGRWSFLDFFHVADHSGFHRDCLLAAVAALADDALRPGFWQRTETVALAATLFSFLLEQDTTTPKPGSSHRTVVTASFKLRFDQLCLDLLRAAGVDRDHLPGSDIAVTQRCAVLASIITTGTLNLMTASFRDWDKLESGLTSAITVLASTSASVVGATALPGAAIGGAAAASAGTIINAIVTAGLHAISGEAAAKAVMERSLRTWLQNLLSALGVNQYSVAGIQVANVVNVNGAAGGASATAGDGSDGRLMTIGSPAPPASTAANGAAAAAGTPGPQAKHAAFKTELLCSFLI